MANDTERWLSDGNCEFCRRKPYCSKQCKANQGFEMRQAVRLGAQMAIDIMSRMHTKHEKEDS